MTFDEVFEEIKDIPGWLGDKDAEVLYKYASRVTGMILEIGCYAGRSTKVLALASPKSKVVTIDPFVLKGNAEVLFYDSVWGLNVGLIKEKSQNVIWQDPIDMLFVDGKHSYRQVVSDIRHFVPYLKPGGYALFHDYTTLGREYGVNKAVSKLKDIYFDTVSLESGIAVCRRKH